MSRKNHGKVVFSESWLVDEQFKTWLKWQNDCHKAACVLCNSSVIAITRMGVSAPVSNAAGAKHEERLTYNPISSFCLMTKNVNKDTPKATSQIYCAMKVLWSHLPYRSCLNLNELFCKMFPDSQVAKSFSALKNKMCLLCCFWFRPIF